MAGEPILGDRYQVQRQLSKSAGRGTLLATDLTTGESVVIKLLLCRASSISDDLKLFQREAETLKTLNHPAIPRYLNYFELPLQEGRGVALVQTYIAGQSLQDCLDHGRIFSEPEVIQIARSLLKILNYLHSHTPPIVHRDIKPCNILLDAAMGDRLGTLYLIDFDSAQNFATTTVGSFTVVGTYGYSPPELTGGRSVKASDLYSLGVTLIALASGIDPAKLPRKGMRLEFEHTVLTLSPALVLWLRQMTDPSLDKRFKSAEAALAALETKPVVEAIAPQKPSSSKITLHKTKGELRVSIPKAIGKTQLQIDQHIVLENYVFGMTYKRSPVIPRRDIWKLERSNSQLLIRAGNQKYELNELTELEQNWLAFELSQWLKLPIR